MRRYHWRRGGSFSLCVSVGPGQRNKEDVTRSWRQTLPTKMQQRFYLDGYSLFLKESYPLITSCIARYIETEIKLSFVFWDLMLHQNGKASFSPDLLPSESIICHISTRWYPVRQCIADRTLFKYPPSVLDVRR